CMKGKEFPLTF
nr:immunoglobulin light chain junction region [Macaca mulatta]